MQGTLKIRLDQCLGIPVEMHDRCLVADSDFQARLHGCHPSSTHLSLSVLLSYAIQQQECLQPCCTQ